MRILLVTDSYAPEVSSAAGLMKELANALHARGHEVTVLTTMPRSKLQSDDRNKDWPESVEENGIRVIRARTVSTHHPNYILRGLAIVLAPFQMAWILRRFSRRAPDFVFIYSPPITFGFIGYLLKRRGARILFNVQDIFPQNAIDLGILKNSLLVSFFRWIERFSYRHADVVTAHSKSNLAVLAAANDDLKEKFAVLHNWVDTSSTIPPHKGYRAQFGLEGRFVALFAGVLGPSQAVHMLVELASRLQDLPDLIFLIVGEGTEKQRAEELARARGLTNVIFKPFIAQTDYRSLLAEVDIGLVSLTTDVKTPVVPGKMLGYMTASLPIAAFVNAESDVHEMLVEAKCGMSCLSNDLASMERIVRTIYADRNAAREMGERGRRYAVENLSKERVVVDIERMLGEGRAPELIA